MNTQINHLKTRITPILTTYNTIQAGLFGSVARGETTPESDIDILVELPKKLSLFDFVGLKLDLEDALGKSVDLVEYSTIHPRLVKQIMSEEIIIYKRSYDDKITLNSPHDKNFTNG